MRYGHLRFADQRQVLQAVSHQGRALIFASEKHRGQRNVVLAAVRQDGQALQFASENLRGDRAVVLEAVRQDGHALRFASLELRSERKMVLEAVKEAWHALYFAAEQLKSDKDVILQVIKEDGRALQFASETLRNDHAVVLEAVRQHGQALEFASEQLRGDVELVVEAMTRDRKALLHVTEEQLRSNQELSLAVGAFSVQLALLSGEAVELRVYPEQSIARLRRDASELLKVDSWALELCIGENRLEDNATVAASGLSAGSVLMAIFLEVQAGLDPADIDLLCVQVPGLSQAEAARVLSQFGGDVIAAIQSFGDRVEERPFSSTSVASSD